MALTPLREIAVCSFQVCDHRLLLARNLRPKQLRFQAPRRASRKLAQEPHPPTDGRAITQLMPAGMIEI
jgi:hypothetical protein